MQTKLYTNVSLRGTDILYRGFDESGQRVHERRPFRPYLYWQTKKPTQWRTLAGDYVERLDFEDTNEARDFIQRYSNVSGAAIYGNTGWQYVFLHDNFAGEIDYQFEQIRVAWLDIETECEDGFPEPERADQKINVITVTMRDSGRNIATTFCLGHAIPVNDTHVIHEFDDEEELLRAFLQFWQKADPDILTGWSVEFFDVPYLTKRIQSILGDSWMKKLSPWGIVKTKTLNKFDNDYTTYEFVGLVILDYLVLYRKFTFIKRPNYKLNTICMIELGEGKTTYTDFSSLREFYAKDFAGFVAYNYNDVELLLKLENKLRLLELAVSIAYEAKINYGDVFSQVRTWDGIIYQHLSEQNIVIPFKEDNDSEDFPGGYVKIVKPAMYHWVVSFDLNSLYPMLICQYALSPECKVSVGRRGDISPEDVLNGKAEALIAQAKQRNVSLAANGVTFRKDIKGFLPTLMAKMYDDRASYKKKMLAAKKELKTSENLSPEKKKQLEATISKCHIFQLAKKINLNSAFGALGNKYFRFYDVEIAEAITISGQLSILWIEKALNKYLNDLLKTSNVDYVVAIDTDSIYLTLENVVKKVTGGKQTSDSTITKFLDKFSQEKLLPYIAAKYAELAEKMNACEQKMEMKRENIAKNGIWTAKKHYILNVLLGEDNVYVPDGDIKVVGLETQRSSTPKFVQEALEVSFRIILTKTEKDLHAFVAQFTDQFYKQPPETIAGLSTVSGLDEYADSKSIFASGTPQHTKAALIYNHYRMEFGFGKDFPSFNNGDKIQLIYLKKPNKLKSDVIGFFGKIPNELEIEGRIDYARMLDKLYLKPLSKVAEAAGWSCEAKATLEDLFG